MLATNTKKALLTALGLLLFLPAVFAQYKLSGGNPVLTGQTYAPYTISGGAWSTADHWSCTNCTLNGTGNSTIANNGTPNISVVWSASGTLSYFSGSNPTAVATLSVTAYSVNNNIETNPNQEFFPDYFPFYPLNQQYTLNLTGTQVSIPGATVTYAWQYSTNNTTWTALPASNTQNYTWTSMFTTPNTYIERLVNVNLNGDNYLYTSAEIYGQGETPITAGAITPSYALIAAGGNPGTFTAAAGSGGTMCGGTNYTYTWQTSTDGINWTTVGSGLTYAPGALSTTTYIRILDYCGPMAGVANAVVMISGAGALQAGTIGPMNITVASGGNAGMLTGNPASGGGATSGYVYTWQSSTDGANFSPISNSNFLNYSPPGNSLTPPQTYFRRAVSVAGQTAYSNIAEILIATPAAPQNVIQTRTVIAAGVTTLGAANALTALTDVKQKYEYFDGLGRSAQTVYLKGALYQSGTTTINTDLITPAAYDAMGRQTFGYLPYPSPNSNGSFDVAGFQDQQSYNSTVYHPQGDNLFYYGQTNYETSPLARVESTTAPGDNWTGANRTNQSFVTSNTVNDNVLEWSVTNSGTPGVFGSYSFNTSGYSPGTLIKTISTNENGNQVINFKDLNGNLILKKVQFTAAPDLGAGSGYTGWLCTYYIYDILNNLRCVIQPQGVQLLILNSWNITSLGGDILNKQCFRYEYDARNRVIMMQKPSAQPEYTVYDNLDRVVMTQNGDQRTPGQWTVNLYESALDRLAATGIWTNASLTFAAALSAAYSSASYPFTLGTAPGTGWELLTQTQYDSYAGIPAVVSGTLTTTGINTTNFYATDVSPVYAQPLTQINALTATTPVATVTTQGMICWTKAEVVGSNGTQYVQTTKIYDSRERVIQQQTYNQTQGLDLATTQYNFAGLPLVQDIRSQFGSTQTYEVATLFSYDALERLVKTQKMLIASVIPSPSWETISTESYDAVGRLVTKTLGNNPAAPGSPLETQAFDYNIRDWGLGVNRAAINSSAATPFFAYELGFDKQATIVAGQNYTKQEYNGNIAGMIWKNAGDQQVKRYDFVYDVPNRLMAANFTEYTGSAFNTSAGLNYSTAVSQYDANGNMITVNTMGWKGGASTTIDALTYNYVQNSNVLLNVIDASPADPITPLGDFHYSTTYTSQLAATGGKTNLTQDYVFDPDGNMTQDRNKDIQLVTYNSYLNLPTVYTIAGSTTNGTITYTYDAAGNRLAKTVQDNNATVNGLTTNITTTTTYITGFVYKSVSYSNTSLSSLNYTNNLQFFGHEEGRVRALYTNPASPYTLTGFAFDYFLKDHLGNTRVTVTEEKETDAYPTLTYEGSSGTDPGIVNQNAVWDNSSGTSINAFGTRVAVPVGFSGGSFGSWCGSVTKAQGAIGAAKLLRVMAGDQLNVQVNYTYSTAVGNNTNANGIGTLVSSLANMILNSGNAVTPVLSAEGTATTLANAQSTSTAATFLTNTWQEVPQTNVPPQAYLHILFFNDQFVFDNTHSIVVPITSAGLNAPGLLGPETPMVAKDGYAYVYFSNESNTTVYFDNFQITDVRGPVLETNDYYPFGLAMAATTGTAMKTPYAPNKYRYNGKELQNQEFANGSGLEQYDFAARFQDPQLGRFAAMDPHAGNHVGLSPFSYADNNPVIATDPSGMDTYLSGQAAQDFFRALQGSLDLDYNYGWNLDISAKRLDELAQQLKEENGGESDFNFTIKAILFVFQAITPETYQHIHDAQMEGYPPILTRDVPENTGPKRDIGLAPYPPANQTDHPMPKPNIVLWNDEYPFASTVEHAYWPSVRPVPMWEQRIQAAQISSLYSYVKPGDRFIVLPLGTDTWPWTSAPAWRYYPEDVNSPKVIRNPKNTNPWPGELIPLLRTQPKPDSHPIPILGVLGEILELGAKLAI